MLSALSAYQPRQLLAQVLNFGLILSTAFMMWKSLSLVTNSPSPIVVVLSGSMEPAFQRGDLLFLWNRGADTQVGEIVVFNIQGKSIPIVHRALRKHVSRPSAKQSKSRTYPPLKLLTKGDNNAQDDVVLYTPGQHYIDREKEVIGSVKAYVPFVGYVTILLSEHPMVKTVVLGIMGLFVILQRE
ncbi:Signal peptidase complex catalytic subunit [Orbilia oligospora]|uniref:Signal peptidase complex catalytic subunit SEC11 n=1 Tax=Orbilia oligospora TaxID=2813651 RepID=A0A7C8J274_ORBOL|nr:Signal peptidase complex catalytic subunit [Orbilia oligospora]KAF3102561.1 Signal peptidase complex catalytic subunit [Orbilia oligospora]KAF3110082.1 Signal peptidase complex catalytic subunit [Orbilia oligospora]KAF3138003.1 Signal peptidase complex catalytic subunit [Orbilia oligospora]KAF3143739.1 Signal peptidase complex catalytic subunit [Orbilia oligospora]